MNKITSASLIDQRRYDVDWLRTLGFILLIFYHIGQFYVVDWDWHVKSAYQSEFLQNIMLLVNRWRMPLIFLISGMALSLVEPKITCWALLKTRFFRVFVPLVIGMYLIVPPQLFFQLIQQEGFDGSYLTFMSFYLDANTEMVSQHQHGPAGLLTWNHLWYLAYLWHYTLVYILIKPLLIRIKWQKLFDNISMISLVLFPALLMTLYVFFLEPLYPKTHALIGDWYNHAVSFSYFLFGYILTKLPLLWQKIIGHHKAWLALALINYVIVLILFNGYMPTILTAIGLNAATFEQQVIYQFAMTFIWTINTIFWLLAIIAFAGKYLTKGNKVLRYLNEAVLPWYILHQTITIIAAMWLSQYALGGFVEPTMLVILTFVGCGLGYEVIRRNNITRFIFGMKLLVRKKDNTISNKTLNTHT